jgi:hypothetical protein
MKARGLALVLLGACCARPTATTPPAAQNGDEHVMTEGLIAKDYLLRRPVKEPAERVDNFPGPPAEPTSPDFAASYAIFEEAQQAYLDKDYRRAADGFVRAAAAMRVRTGVNAPTAARNRWMLYENAAYAWMMAGDAPAGRATLARLRKEGVATAEDVAPALRVLGEP